MTLPDRRLVFRLGYALNRALPTATTSPRFRATLSPVRFVASSRLRAEARTTNSHRTPVGRKMNRVPGEGADGPPRKTKRRIVWKTARNLNTKPLDITPPVVNWPQAPEQFPHSAV